MSVERKKETIEVWNVCECGRTLSSINEGKRGQCSSCWVKSMPRDTKNAINQVIAAAFAKERTTTDEAQRLIGEAIAKLDRDNKG